MQIQKSGCQKRRLSAEERTGVLAKYRASGKTQKQFCKDEGVAVATLTLWLGKSRREQAGGQLMEVTMPRLVGGSALEVELVECGVRVRVNVGTPAKWVGEVILALRCGA